MTDEVQSTTGAESAVETTTAQAEDANQQTGTSSIQPTIESELAEAKAQIAAQATEISSLQGTVSTLQSVVSILQSRISALEDEKPQASFKALDDPALVAKLSEYGIK